MNEAEGFRTKSAAERITAILERGCGRKIRYDGNPASGNNGVVDPEIECARWLRAENRGLAANDGLLRTRVDLGCCVADISQ
jgi:hypothetical protein